jgi:hypothetical protein
MVHPSNGESWKALDKFDPDFARDARNICIMLATDSFTPFTESDASYSCCVTPTFYKNKNFAQIGVHIKMHIKL